MYKRTPNSTGKFLWIKVTVLIIGFLGVIKMMAWLKEPQNQKIEPPSITAKVKIGDEPTARPASN